MGVKKTGYYTVEEYLKLEALSELKNEFERGAILAMSGGTINHGILCGNVYSEIRRGLDDNQSNCKVFGSEIRVHIKENDSIVYPDAMVICGDIEASDEDKNAITNPILIVEVLSNSTSNYDRGDKFHKYRLLPSFREYLLVNQDSNTVEIFFKNEDDTWTISRIAGLDKTIPLKSIKISIDMARLYQNI